MISGIGLYIKLCLDYHRHNIQNRLSLSFSRRFTEHWKSIRLTFISSSLFSGFLFPKDENEKKEGNSSINICTNEKVCPKKFIIVGNLKMNGNGHDVKSIISKIKKCKCGPDIDIVIAVPSVYLELARKHDGKNIYVAAQNCHKSERNYTGEISAVMLDDLNIEWVLLGDCVRRTLFKESDELIGTKADDALCEGLNVIACLVERKEDDKTGEPHEAILSQLKAISDRTDDWCGIVLAYQPVWTFKENITTIKVQEMHSLIRGWIRDNVDENAAKNTRIIYAGKVDSYNALELAEQKDIDGFLIGEKSLTKEFLQIINALKKIKKNVACLNDQDKPKG